MLGESGEGGMDGEKMSWCSERRNEKSMGDGGDIVWVGGCY